MFEMVGAHVSSQSVGVGPCFANHKHVGLSGAFKGVVRDTTLVCARGCRQGQSGLEGFGILAFVCFEETVYSKLLLSGKTF